MPKQRFRAVRRAPAESYPLLLRIWEESVRATHDFLAPGEIERLMPEVEKAFAAVEHLLVYVNTEGETCGFAGVDDGRVEMLFASPRFFGQGVGSTLFDFAVQELGALEVDVNEQNTGGVRFYNRKGFETVSRQETDPYGNPYPILTLRKA